MEGRERLYQHRRQRSRQAAGKACSGKSQLSRGSGACSLPGTENSVTYHSDFELRFCLCSCLYIFWSLTQYFSSFSSSSFYVSRNGPPSSFLSVFDSVVPVHSSSAKPSLWDDPPWNKGPWKQFHSLEYGLLGQSQPILSQLDSLSWDFGIKT